MYLNVQKGELYITLLNTDLPLTTEADKCHTLSLPGCRFHFVASALSLPSCRFHVVALNLKGGLYSRTLTERSASLLGITVAVLYFCIVSLGFPAPLFRVVASALSPPRCRPRVVASTLSLPHCRFQVVASKLSLPSCRFQVVASTLSLPRCRFHVVASTLSLPSCRFRVVVSLFSLPSCRFHVVGLTSCCTCTVRARFERRKLL